MKDTQLIDAATETLTELRDSLRAGLDPSSPWAGNALSGIAAALDNLGIERARVTAAVDPQTNGSSNA